MNQVINTRFFHFRQNNSGGSFDVDNEKGISVNVIIEAINANNANARAEEIGLYFNGCAIGLDCNCCGDRWNTLDDEDGYEVPSIYGENAYEKKADTYGYNYAYIHFLNGKKEEVTFKK